MPFHVFLSFVCVFMVDYRFPFCILLLVQVEMQSVVSLVDVVKRVNEC